jgi:hypothetical protein
MLAPASCAAACAPGPRGWRKEWDRILIEKAVLIEDQRYDAAERMVSRNLGPEYRYHTKMRERRVHPTRDSLEYALCMLELGGQERAERAAGVIDRVVNLQVADPQSKWHGIWGWYMEEPPDKMAPADWNWADFNGSLLLLIEFRHGGKLDDAPRARVREAIRRAAASIRRRNVSMSYTNIAIKGTFVTLAAAELFKDEDLGGYARDRMVRLCAEIDRTGSFAEYNSPTYARVSLTNLTRMRMFLRDPGMLKRAEALERRLWLHLAAHWDAARAQFAGPMSRCYATDIGHPVWLEKSLDGRLGLATPDNRSPERGGSDGETGIHDYRCPEDLAVRFLKPSEPRQHRELFILGDGGAATHGTTYIGRGFSLGSVNRGDFWVQRRPLLAYFGGASRPARNIAMRVVKDGYDFSSALLHSVQERNCILGAVGFRNPGGDKHISLDPIENGEFQCGRLFLELDFEGLAEGFKYASNERMATVESRDLCACFAVPVARFGGYTPALRATPSTQSLVVTLDFLPPGPARKVRWAEVSDAYAGFALALGEDRSISEEFAKRPVRHRVDSGILKLDWDSPAGALALECLARAAPVEAFRPAFKETAGGKPVPVVRLSEDKLA